jgi:ABC-2 type transport system ATP-binding protein
VTAVLEAEGLSKRYGRNKWALRDCSINIPQGHVVGLVGPNGAGKSTLLNLAVGLLSPTQGSVKVLDDVPANNAHQLARVGFVAQDPPIFSGLSVRDHLHLGDAMNPKWDQDLAVRRMSQLGIDPRQRAGKLSGGQRAQVALTLAIAKRPEVLILDEPVASLDPLARREFLQILMETVAEHDVSVVLSSHLVADIERVCDYLIVLTSSRVQVAGDIEDLLATHHRLIGPRRESLDMGVDQHVISSRQTERQSTFFVRSDGPIVDPSWTIEAASLEDLVLAYMGQGKEVEQNLWSNDEAES